MLPVSRSGSTSYYKSQFDPAPKKVGFVFVAQIQRRTKNYKRDS